MKHLLSTLLLSCTFISVTAMDKTNGNPSSMNVSEADSLRTELPSVQEIDFKFYKDELLDEQSRPEFDIYKQYLLDILDLEKDEISNHEFQHFYNYWNNIHKGDQNILLNEYINYTLYKNASATGEKAKTFSEAFVEYQKQNPNSSVVNLKIYKKFLEKTLSLSQPDITKMVGLPILFKSFLSLKKVLNSNSTPSPLHKNTLTVENTAKTNKVELASNLDNNHKQINLANNHKQINPKNAPQPLKNLVNDNNTPLNSFQDYCKWLETETDNWNLYIQYWMFKNNKKENPTPEEGMVLLHEYTEHVLNKKALKAGEKAKTVSEAFEEYKKERYPGITTTSFNYIIYAQFFKDTCSLTDDELQFFGIEMSSDYYSRYLRKTAPTNVDSEDSTDVDTIDPSTAIDLLNSTSSDTTIVDLLNSTSSDTTKQQQQVTTYKEPSAQKQLFIDLNTANKRKHDELDQTMEPQAKNVKRLHDIMQNLDEVFTQIKEKNQPVDIEATIIDKNGKTRTLSFCFSGGKQPQTEKNNQKLLKKTTKHS